MASSGPIFSECVGGRKKNALATADSTVAKKAGHRPPYRAANKTAAVNRGERLGCTHLHTAASIAAAAATNITAIT
jgi:hypothetical protein